MIDNRTNKKYEEKVLSLSKSCLVSYLYVHFIQIYALFFVFVVCLTVFSAFYCFFPAAFSLPTAPLHQFFRSDFSPIFQVCLFLYHLPCDWIPFVHLIHSFYMNLICLLSYYMRVISIAEI